MADPEEPRPEATEGDSGACTHETLTETRVAEVVELMLRGKFRRGSTVRGLAQKWGVGEQRLLPPLIDLVRRGKFRLFGEPDRKIDPCHVDNAAHAHALAVAKLEPGSAIAGKAYFIGNGEPMTIEAFFTALLRAGGFPAEKRRHSALTAKALATAARPGSLITPYLLDLFSRSSCFNLAAARGDLGYAPKLNTAEGMSRLFTALTRVRMQSRSP